MMPSPQPFAMDGLRAGFADGVRDAQHVFRRVLEAMAHPGRVLPLDIALDPPPPLSPGSAALCLALIDGDTPLWLDRELSLEPIRHYLRFHCGAPLARSPDGARFAVIADPADMPALDAFDAGDDEYPERSTTLIVQVSALAAGDGWRLSGPGIERESRLAIRGLPERFRAEWRLNHARFPRGVDVLLVAGSQVAALPRSTVIEG
jgi:alpha-D-ribose 1-methylphosphonate 5-triphosphate synthase subunit PhnH